MVSVEFLTKLKLNGDNESHVHNCYVIMQSICCQGDKSLVPGVTDCDW